MPHCRLASRILLISPTYRLLLFKIQYKTGALEAAAVRELKEETGVNVQSVGPCIAHREFPWKMPDGEGVLAIENYYVVRADTEQCSSATWSVQEQDTIGEVRWWSQAELAECDDDVYPPDLMSLFTENLVMATE